MVVTSLMTTMMMLLKAMNEEMLFLNRITEPLKDSTKTAAPPSRYSVYLLYWYKSTNTDAAAPPPGIAPVEKVARGLPPLTTSSSTGSRYSNVLLY